MAKHARYVLVIRWDGKDGKKEQEFGTIIAETESDAFEQLLDPDLTPRYREKLMERLEGLAMALGGSGDGFYEKHSLYRIDDEMVEVNRFHPDPGNPDGKILKLHLIPVCTFKNGAVVLESETQPESPEPPWIMAFGCSRGIDRRKRPF